MFERSTKRFKSIWLIIFLFKKCDDMKKLYLLAILALALAVANAAVFVYYPMTVNITGVRPVVFDYGSNADQPDLGTGNNIAVTLGASNTSVTIGIHPTYEYTYYHNVTLVKNIDTGKSYYVAFRVTQPITGWPSDSIAKMIIYGSDNQKKLEIDLKATAGTTTSWIGSLNAGDYYRIDFYIYYPEGNQLPSNTQVQLQLIYSPQGAGSAPTVPPS